ncbi:MAG: hypothetical protein WCO98_12090 [bacterium]
MKHVNPDIILAEVFGIIIVITLLIIFLHPFFGHHGGIEKPRPPTCLSNQRQIAAGLAMYIQDHDDIFPESSTIWGVIQIDKPLLICPQDKKNPNGYLYNNNLSGVNYSKISNYTKNYAKKMVTIDGKTTIGPNRSLNNTYYTPADVLFRHYEKEKNMYWAVASYVDGHVSLINKVTEPESWDKPIIQKKTGVKK